MKNVLTPQHKEWEKFCELLQGPEGGDFKRNSEGKFTWRCKGNNDKTYAQKILKKYFPYIDIEKTFEYFERHNGYCDCEILFNVDIEE